MKFNRRDVELEPLKNTYSIGEKGILAQISKNILSYLHFRSSERDFWLFWIFIIIFFIFMFFFLGGALYLDTPMSFLGVCQ